MTAPAARALWSWPGFDLVKQPQQQVREQHDLAGYDWVVIVHGSMRGRVLEQAGRPREQVHRSQLLAPSATVSTRGPGELDGYVAMQSGVVAEQVDKELAVRWVTGAGAFLAAPGRPLAIAASDNCRRLVQNTAQAVQDCVTANSPAGTITG